MKDFEFITANHVKAMESKPFDSTETVRQRWEEKARRWNKFLNEESLKGHSHLKLRNPIALVCAAISTHPEPFDTHEAFVFLRLIKEVVECDHAYKSATTEDTATETIFTWTNNPFCPKCGKKLETE